MLLKKIEDLKKSEIKKIIDIRNNEFENFSMTKENVFSELCFCLLTANFNAERSIKIQEKIGAKELMNLDITKLSEKLKILGHRFPNTRAKYIISARKNITDLYLLIKDKNQEKSKEIRIWLVKNVKGLGYKEASHFLRNIGFNNLAIIDFHIIDLLVKEGLIKKMKKGSLTKRKYLEIEQILFDISKKAKLNLSQLDLYLWYLETGKILK